MKLVLQSILLALLLISSSCSTQLNGALKNVETPLPAPQTTVATSPAIKSERIMMDLLDGIWNGVTVGISTEQDVLSAFGSPSKIYHEDFTELKTTTYSYFDKNYIQSGFILITLKGGVVDVIELDSEAIQRKGGPRLMVDLVNLLGRPDIVSWSSLQGSRTLIWPTKGVAAMVRFWDVEVDSSENYIWILEIFPPLDTNTFRESTYYARLIPEANLYPTSEANASEDPFDWNRFFQTPTPP